MKALDITHYKHVTFVTPHVVVFYVSFLPTINPSVNNVGSRYIWLKNNMPALFKPFNVDCTVIDASEMHTDKHFHWAYRNL